MDEKCKPHANANGHFYNRLTIMTFVGLGSCLIIRESLVQAQVGPHQQSVLTISLVTFSTDCSPFSSNAVKH